jgi:hypothetical protein
MHVLDNRKFPGNCRKACDRGDDDEHKQRELAVILELCAVAHVMVRRANHHDCRKVLQLCWIAVSVFGLQGHAPRLRLGKTRRGKRSRVQLEQAVGGFRRCSLKPCLTTCFQY